MQIIDTHTHIYAEEFDADWEAMLQRALEAGVSTMIMPSVDSTSYPRLRRAYEACPDHLRVALGLHPTSVDASYEHELAFVEAHLGDLPLVAIGEIGLDYYWDTTYRAEQIEAFGRQIALASRLGLPIIVHTRDAFADTFATIRQAVPQGQVRGVFHSFTGSEAELDEALAFEGFMIGLGGVVTFKNSLLRSYVGRIPLDRLLLETDAPYLSPVPKRGKRNEPAHLTHILEHLAPLWGLTPPELASATTLNAQRLFAL